MYSIWSRLMLQHILNCKKSNLNVKTEKSVINGSLQFKKPKKNVLYSYHKVVINQIFNQKKSNMAKG